MKTFLKTVFFSSLSFEVWFWVIEMNGDFVPEPTENYALQLCYRAKDSWRVVWDPDEVYNKFVFNDILKAEKPQKGKQKISFQAIEI